jgi:preprotein translocase subunit SecG
MIPLGILSVFLVLVILVQRGRGGGLTGALGGMGGQSAFGTKAGDLFTRVTIVVAAIWVVLSMASLKVLNQASNTAGLNAGERGRPTATTKPGEGGLLPSATTPDTTKSGETPAEKAADDQPAATKTGTESEAPAATPAPSATPPAATEAPAPSSPAPSNDAKPADEAKP